AKRIIMSGEEPANRIGEKHTTGDSRRGPERSRQKTASRTAALAAPRDRRGARRSIALRWPLPAALRRRLAPAAVRRHGRAGRGRGAGTPKQGAEPAEKAARTRPTRRSAFQLLDLAFELLQTIVGGAKRLVLDEDGLRQIIGCVRLSLGCILDQRLGFRIARRTGGAANPVEQTCEQLAFFG